MLRKKKRILIAVGLVIAFLFFWYQIRPSLIRSTCAKETGTKIESEYSNEKRSTKGWQDIYDLYYDSCLHKKGL